MEQASTQLNITWAKTDDISQVHGHTSTAIAYFITNPLSCRLYFQTGSWEARTSKAKVKPACKVCVSTAHTSKETSGLTWINPVRLLVRLVLSIELGVLLHQRAAKLEGNGSRDKHRRQTVCARRWICLQWAGQWDATNSVINSSVALGRAMSLRQCPQTHICAHTQHILLRVAGFVSQM